MYDRLCQPTGNEKIDSLTCKVYNKAFYDDDGDVASNYEKEFKNLFIDFLMNKQFKQLSKSCFNILVNIEENKWLAVCNCQNTVYIINESKELNSESVCLGQYKPLDIITYMFDSNFQEQEIITLLNFMNQIINDESIDGYGNDTDYISNNVVDFKFIEF